MRKNKVGKNVAPVRRRVPLSDDDAATFRRSRTLTGSLSSSVRAAGEARSELKSERIREHELRVRRRRIGAALFGFLIVILAGLALLSQFGGSFRDVTITNSNAVSRVPDVETYRQIAEEYFAKKPLERFTFAFREATFSEFVTTRVPEVKSADVVTHPFSGGDLLVTLREPVAVWDINGVRSYVDSDGVVFAKNYFAEPTVAIHDQSGATVEGGAVTSRRFLKFVGMVMTQINTSGIGTVESVTIPSGAVRYVEFRLAGRTYPYKAQIDRVPISQASDIINMTRFLDQRGITPTYVDVRVEGKGYWK